MTKGQLGRYQIQDTLGSGTHGEVYRASLASDPREIVALKIIEHAGSLSRLLIEPELLGRFDHPNIVHLKDYWIEAGKLVLAMEYIEGVDLDRYLQSHPRMSTAEVREFLRQMASALAHAHAHDVFHSDIKPSNIIVQKRASGLRFVLVDFGVARMAAGVQTRKRITGTYHFMAPEQLLGRGGKAADLWALGTIAFMMLTGTPPFPGGSLDELTKQLLYRNPVFPESLPEPRDRELERAVLHLLEKNTVDRTHSAEVLLRELNEVGSPAKRDARVAPSPDRSWDQQVKSQIRKCWLMVALFAFLASVTNGLVPGLTVFAGGAVISLGAEKRRSWYTCAGFLLLALGMIAFAVSGRVLETLGLNPRFLDGWLMDFASGILLLPAGVYLARGRRLKRELVLAGILRKDASDTLPLIKAYVDVNVGDFRARRRYIEALLSANQPKEAAVEALAMLRTDPYNFDATLLLAHAYLELRLYERCNQVCNGYLQVSAQSFEFDDIRRQAAALQVATS